jgi:uncharacterized Zn-binding protein involved in type VI secretion
MPQIHRLTDPNTAGAPVTQVVQSKVYANNLLVAVNGSPVEGHGTGEHSSPKTANGSTTVFIENIPVNKQGDADTCGHTRAQGSSDVYVDDGTNQASATELNTPQAGTRIVEGRVVYDNTPAGIAALVREEKRVSPGLPAYHEEKPSDAPANQESPPPKPTPPEGCKNSKYYALADSKMAIEAQQGLTKEQIECNWIALCTNILDVVRDAGFNFKINSGFRTLSYNRSIGSSDGSDHTIGCAADISMGSQEANKTLFKALLNKYPYSQLIFEGNWVHVAYGGRGPKGNAKVMYTYTGKAPQVAGANGDNLPSDLKTA